MCGSRELIFDHWEEWPRRNAALRAAELLCRAIDCRRAHFDAFGALRLRVDALAQIAALDEQRMRGLAPLPSGPGFGPQAGLVNDPHGEGLHHCAHGEQDAALQRVVRERRERGRDLIELESASLRVKARASDMAASWSE